MQEYKVNGNTVRIFGTVDKERWIEATEEFLKKAEGRKKNEKSNAHNSN